MRILFVPALLAALAAPLAHAQPANDALASATVVSPAALPAALTGTNVGATLEPGEVTSGNCGYTEETSVWWAFTPATSATYVFSTDGSDFNTSLSLWTGSSHPLAEVACNDDVPSLQTSRVSAALTAGTTYYVKVAGVEDESGSIALAVQTATAPANDDLAAAIVINPAALPATLVGNTDAATREAGEAIASCSDPDFTREASVWWAFTPAADGPYVFATEATEGQSGFDTILSLWTGSSHPLTEVACNDEVPGSGFFSRVPLTLTAGTTYYVKVSGYRESTGDVTLVVTRLRQGGADNRADATLVQGALPQAFASTTAGATLEPGEAVPGCDRSDAVRSVWLRYVPTATGTLSVGVDPDNPFVAHAVAVFDGNTAVGASCFFGGRAEREPDPLSQGRAGRGEGAQGPQGTRGTQVYLAVNVTAGTPYDIRISAPDEFPFTLGLDGPASLPVELASFTAAAAGRTARLSWTTASETNNAGFVVERQSGSAWADASPFVAGHGTTAERHTYAYAVDGLTAGTHVFRLRQVDTDGAVEHSAPVTVEIGLAEPVAVTVLGQRTLRIETATAGPVEASVVDVLGRRLLVQRVEVSGTAELPLPALAPGAYVVRVVGAGFAQARAFVVR